MCLSGSCVRTLGGDRQFCNANEFESYDPYALEWKDAQFPDAFLHSGNGDLAPAMDEHRFGMWSANYNKTKKQPPPNYKGAFNSGEDTQSFASVIFYPFLSDLVAKENALRTYSGHYIANALTTHLRAPKPETLSMPAVQDQLQHQSLLSIYAGKPDQFDNMLPYLKQYTETVSPFGSRSTMTLQILLQRRIKSYFSACLTLMTNMIGAQMDPSSSPSSCNSTLCQTMIFKSPPANRTKDMIVMVDVADPSAVPKAVQDKAVKFTAKIPARYPIEVSRDYILRMSYNYRMLSLYANRARVIITSRIHVGLPATALGIPVIFVENGNWLPGGIQSVGRVAGLLDVFYRVGNGKGNWTFGDLSDDIDVPPGVHLADRYRASFWNRLKKQSSFYADTGTLFGMIPLQRLGRNLKQPGYYSNFHFMLDRQECETLSWQTKRAMEHALYFHPNGRLHLHLEAESKEATAFVTSMLESGYDVTSETYSPRTEIRGVYISKHTHITQPIPTSIESGVIWDPSSGTALWVSSTTEVSLDEVLHNPSSSISTNNLKPSQVTLLDAAATVKCFQEADDVILDTSSSTERLAVVLDPSSHQTTLWQPSTCFGVVESTCIFCEDIHWEFPSLHQP